MPSFLVSIFQMYYMYIPCLESVINNEFPSFLQQNGYFILAQYHYNILKYFIHLVGSQFCTQCLLLWKYITQKQ